MRFCYADPPYPGCAHFYPEKTEIDHATLIGRLCDEFPDGWALSSHVPALRNLLPVCPTDVRVLAWCKSWCSFKPSVRIAYAWEPVIVRGGRPRTRQQDTVRDFLVCPITTGRGMVGAKPEQFCHWLFGVLKIQPGDEFVDLFPGSGAVTRAWAKWQSRLPEVA
jgi:hypothetical protein